MHLAARLAAYTRESNLQNNTSSVRNQVISTPDLTIRKSVNKDRTFAGDVLTYTLTVVNQGPSVARNAQVIDVLPDGLTVLGATPAPLTLASPLQWEIEQIHVGEMRKFVYTVRTDGTLAAGTLLRNTAQVSATGDTD